MDQHAGGGAHRHLRGKPVLAGLAACTAASTRSGAATGSGAASGKGIGEARPRGRGRWRRRERIPGRRQERKGSTPPGLRPLLKNLPKQPAPPGGGAPSGHSAVHRRQSTTHVAARWRFHSPFLLAHVFCALTHDHLLPPRNTRRVPGGLSTSWKTTSSLLCGALIFCTAWAVDTPLSVNCSAVRTFGVG